MTAMSLYIAEAHIAELHASRLHSGWGNVSSVLTEIVQVIKGSVLPLGGVQGGLGHGLRRDLGLD